MIAYFLSGNNVFLLIIFVIVAISYLISSYGHMYNVKINFKNFCLNSDFFKINIDSPSCQSNTIKPRIVSVTKSSPVGGNIQVKTIIPTSTK
uniref:Uncharacterized protein n=1 Tax=viral metagenome TaxID=1070528 RepID=A0A6C0H0I2_9ZZZZ